MLEVFDAETEKADITDIDAAFSGLRIPLGDTIGKLVAGIDGGIAADENTFFDRFGVRLYYSELSTGCKAAICVACNPTAIVDLQECGLNARDAIFNYCEDGKVLLHDFGVTIVNKHTRKTPIHYAGKDFSIDSFNEVVL